MDVIQRAAFHAHAFVPVVKAVVDHWQEFESVEGNGIREAKGVRQHKQHEEILLVPLRSCIALPEGRDVVFAQTIGDLLQECSAALVVWIAHALAINCSRRFWSATKLRMPSASFSVAMASSLSSKRKLCSLS